MVHAALFHSVLDALGDIREWQVIQPERNRLDLRLELMPRQLVLARIAAGGP